MNDPCRDLVLLDTDSRDLANHAAEATIKNYHLNGTSNIQVREAKVQLVEAESRLLNAQLMAKAAEIELFRLSGGLNAALDSEKWLVHIHIIYHILNFPPSNW